MLYILGWVNWFYPTGKAIRWYCCLKEAMKSQADCSMRQLIQSWLSRHWHIMTLHWHTEKRNISILSRHTHKQTRGHWITTKWQMSKNPAPQTLLSFICKWAHRYSLHATLFTQKPKDGANFQSDQTGCQMRWLGTKGSQTIRDKMGHDEAKWAKMPGFKRSGH